MEISHIIYILDHPMFRDHNINFLSFIKHNIIIIRNMGVKITINTLTLDKLDNPDVKEFLIRKNIDIFPVLITKNKIYKGLHDIVNIYKTNIAEYNNYIRNQEMQMQNKKEEQSTLQVNNRLHNQGNNIQVQLPNKMQQKYAPVEDEENIHSYISDELQIKNKVDDDEESPFGEIGNNSMMDTYRHMMTRRSKDNKNPYSSNMRTLEDSSRENIRGTEPSNMQDVIYKQLQNNTIVNKCQTDSINQRQKQMQRMKSNIEDTDDEDREDNIKGDIGEEVINIDPSKIEYDADDDPGDAILEKAYWSRNAETK